MIDGNLLAAAGVGVAAFDVYAYYKYKHALDVLEERRAAKAAQTEEPETDAATEAGLTGVETAGDEALVFESDLPVVGDVPAVTLGDFQPSQEEFLAEAASKPAKRAAKRGKAKRAKRKK